MGRCIARIFVAAGFVAGLTIFANASECHDGAAAGDKMMLSSAVNAGNKVCPVSGEKIADGVKTGMQHAAYEYKGTMYNFCCPACIGEFKKDPDKYIKKVEDELKGAQETK